MTSIKLHSFSATPVEFLLRKNNDSELTNTIRKYNLPAHQQVNLIRAAVTIKNRTTLMAKPINRKLSYALLSKTVGREHQWLEGQSVKAHGVVVEDDNILEVVTVAIRIFL